MTNANIPANLNQPNVANIQNIPNAPNPSNVTGPNVVSGPNVVGGPNVSVPNVGGPVQLQGAAQMNTMNQMNPMMNMQHMPRNQPANVLYQGSNYRIWNDNILFEFQVTWIIDFYLHFSSKSYSKSTVLQKKSKSIGSFTDGWEFADSNGAKSIGTITTSD